MCLKYDAAFRQHQVDPEHRLDLLFCPPRPMVVCFTAAFLPYTCYILFALSSGCKSYPRTQTTDCFVSFTLFSMAEVCTGIICGCLPVFPTFLRVVSAFFRDKYSTFREHRSRSPSGRSKRTSGSSAVSAGDANVRSPKHVVVGWDRDSRLGSAYQ